MFIGRKVELDFLNNKYSQKNGQLVVLYGRRRVGKTETLREFCKDKEHVFYSCRECTDDEQLKSFSARMLKQEMPISKYVTTFKDWEQAFNSISELPSKSKKLLIIDEFPYMAKNNESISSILQNLWDHKLKDQDIMIILCGSSMSFIEDKLLSEKNPLYGRATGILKMREMGFFDAVKFFPNYNDLDKVIAYSILGGIPHYLKQFDKDKSIQENIKSNILTKGCILYSEVEFLMHQELRETTLYNTIVEAVALGNTKINDIFNKTNIDKSKLSVYIKNLISLEIMQREFSVDSGIKEKANTSRGIYNLTDNFFSFWYHFVFPNISELEAGDTEGVLKYSIIPELDVFVSYKFEEICRQYVRKQNIEGKLPFRYEKLGRYWQDGEEIDIMAVSKDKKSILAGECKYRNKDVELKDYLELTGKMKVSNKKTKIYYFLFSKNGFTKDLKALESESVKLISIPDLFGES